MGEDAPYVVHAPAIPQAPSFSGSTKQERRAFMRLYQKYVAQVNALQTARTRPFVMPVSASMDHFAKRRVALWDFNGTYVQIAESEWIAWFNLVFEEEPRDLDSLKKRLETTILFDVKILAAESRVSKMPGVDPLRGRQDCRGPYGQGGVAFDATVGSSQQTKRNTSDEEKSSKPAKAPDSRGHAPKRPDGKMLDGGAGPAKPRTLDGVARPDASLAPARKPAVCLKCEAQDLLTAQMQKWKDAREVLPTANVFDLGPNWSKIEGGATVADVVMVDNLLLDTRAKVNVPSVGLVAALEKAGVVTQVVVDDTPPALYPYGKATKPVLLSRRLRLSVALTTTCGPLLLRGLPVWIDDDADDDVALIFSRPLIPRIHNGRAPGQRALAQARTLLSIGCVPAVQDFDLEAGMECSTPVLDALPGESKEDRQRRCESEVKAILASKVEEARSLGLGQDEVERIENLLSRFVDVFRKDVGCDPPIKVEPLQVCLKPDAVPVKCSMRRNPPDHV
ncbi:hypothetical protein H310_10893 [Aphanomyces invadans]|uniref:Uncharacterized protein n=1 Tax=Aphanomyces invadans TaxID=157072 RepID=A0A024TNZ0_9STRA|nr:hypothetical protein H310_10893 [Aphanomyces invadans]ETV95850.1 hypothetical protein H310_10893 [Aphanomyces invadans]|eukprot:XP_008875601.1 hypothetical protein H310_10893 [Aphanomyces invadans]